MPTGGTWIDGRPIYRKVVRVGALKGALRTVAHGISGLSTVVHLHGTATVQMDDGRLLRVTLPRVASSSDTNETDVRKHLVSLSANQTSIEVSPGSLAKFDDSTVIVEYTRS